MLEIKVCNSGDNFQLPQKWVTTLSTLLMLSLALQLFLVSGILSPTSSGTQAPFPHLEGPSVMYIGRHL